MSLYIIAFDCGMKYNIVRHLVHPLCVRLTVVPYHYDLAANPEHVDYDGIFVSNGPGDPVLCAPTVASLAWAIAQMPRKPIFGVCLGNQLLALAAGGIAYKMPYGNRGHNQPCIDMATTKCYMTAQNHGYTVTCDGAPASM